MMQVIAILECDKSKAATSWIGTLQERAVLLSLLSFPKENELSFHSFPTKSYIVT